MARKPQLLDRFGNPLRRSELTREVAAPTFGGARSPMLGYAADGLNPIRLTQILRAADNGDPVRYMELAETIEERDPHYLGVLGTRKRAVSQLDIKVKPGGKTPKAKEMAARVEAWVDRDELSGELFEILDAVGKSYSLTEILWDRSAGQWEPKRLERRDQRWFRFERQNLSVPLVLDDLGREQPLPAFKFIYARMSAKSGLPLRSGIARVASWVWLFKALTQRDWAIFTQTYGQPLRVGKYGQGASEEDRKTLFHAVANIAGDMAAIIPEGMMIEFAQMPNLGAALDLYERRCDWLDKQTSKLVLGQTATTDAVTGGLGSGKEHREVQEDIERADAKQLTAIINQDLIQPWMMLEFETTDELPRIVIGREEGEDLAALSSAAAPFLAYGYRPKAEMLEKMGLELAPKSPNSASQPETAPDEPDDGTANPSESEFKYHLNTRNGSGAGVVALQAETPPTGLSGDHGPEADLADRLETEATPAIGALMAQVEALLATSSSLEDFREKLFAAYPDLDAAQLSRVTAQAIFAAEAGGRAMIEDNADA
ncbi:DUF935 domain-containing protein [Rhodobacteraceae bacterium M382]|nr:DUF935 domain-containing protein [Rhodobacteraceae bacterium M382]